MINKLTDDQIAELAPDWATHYGYACGDLVFVDCKACKINESITKPIPRKKFDISEYEFSDSIAEFEVEVCDTLVLKSHGSWFSFDKDDAIAIARHFNLTADDLK